MLLQIDFKSGKPVYLQLVDQIRYAAASGGLRTGEPLPSIRPLAEELRVNRNTSPRPTRSWKARASSRRFPARAVFSRRAIRRSPSPRARKF
jgi:DNA-binding transcriptional MocR family regulator